MARRTDDFDREPSGWNIWLTLMVLSIAFSIAVAVLEYLGVFGDLGLVRSVVSLGLAVAFGLGGSSQRTVELVRFDLRGVRRDLARLGDDLGGLRDTTSRGFAEMTRGLADVTRGLAEVSRGVADVAVLLRERLPRP
jgi:hypothetical protein